MQGLRLCLGLASFVAKSVLHNEARIIPRDSRFRQLTVMTYLKLYGAPLSNIYFVFITTPDSFFKTCWRRYRQPQAIFVQALLLKLQVSLLCLMLPRGSALKVQLIFHCIFPKHGKLLPGRILKIPFKIICQFHSQFVNPRTQLKV